MSKEARQVFSQEETSLDRDQRLGKRGRFYQISHRRFEKGGLHLIEMRFVLGRETWPRADFSKTYQQPPPYVSPFFFSFFAMSCSSTTARYTLVIRALAHTVYMTGTLPP
jgi:hypothetical protein